MKSETSSLKITINKLEFWEKKKSYYSIKRLKRKDLLLLSNKSIENVHDPCNAKEHFESSLRKINKKSVRQSEIITDQPKHLTLMI